MRAKFGTAGSPDAFLKEKGASSRRLPAWLQARGLDAYEYQCGKGVTLGEETARVIGQSARDSGVTLSLHAPYFINPANPDPVRREKNLAYVLASCRAADWMGAGRVVVHTGAVMKRPRMEALAVAKETFGYLRQACDAAGFAHILLCPETMGKLNQLGDLEEVLEICTLDSRLLPCVDFGHLYARSLGQMEGEAAMAGVLDRMVEVLGLDRAKVFHSHFSQIAYTLKGGEARHLTFDQEDYGPDFAPLGREIACRGWGPTVICESAGTQDVDALTMQALYQSALDSVDDHIVDHVDPTEQTVEDGPAHRTPGGEADNHGQGAAKGQP